MSRHADDHDPGLQHDLLIIAAQVTARTLVLADSVAAGHTGTVTIGVPLS